MFLKKSVYVLPLAVLLFLSLITTASTGGDRVDADSGGGDQKLTVYIHSLQSVNGNSYIVADEIEWYQGDQAYDIFAEREPEAAAEIGGPPDDYYIVNDSETLTTYPLADEATILMQLYDHTGNITDLDIQWNEEISPAHFIDQYGKTDIIDLSQFPYHITIHNGEITSIVQQYVP